MIDFFKRLGQRLGGPKNAQAQTDISADMSADMSAGTAAAPLPATPDELEYIMAQAFYRRDGQYDDDTPKWQLRRCVAVKVRADMWQIRETRHALHAPPSPETPDITQQGEVLSDDIVDMVDNLEEALGLLKAFEDGLDAEDWLAGAAPPEHPTRAEVSAFVFGQTHRDAAE